MKSEKRPMRVLISGGGTGGHIFPAVSIANEIKHRFPDTEILFVGAESRMEMEKVPAAGYKIIGLPVYGLDRKNLLRNFKVVWNLGKSISKARKIVKEFKPDIAVGVGGYASGPTLWAAARMGVPTLLQEQNGFAGVTNKMLASKAKAICVAYEGMERFFPADRIVMTGNPVRQDLFNDSISRQEALSFFGLSPERKTILVVGGSLGALTVNRSIASAIEQIKNSGVQLIWQTGKGYDQQAQTLLKEHPAENIKQMAFISRMDMAYKAADLVISRAGASSISELCLLEKPVILVPSPNVAEDHQTKNAEALSTRGAAILIKDVEAVEKLVPAALSLIENNDALQEMSKAISALAQRNSAARIVEIVCKIVDEHRK